MEIISLIDFKENAVLLYVHYHNIYILAIISFILSRNQWLHSCESLLVQ